MCIGGSDDADASLFVACLIGLLAGVYLCFLFLHFKRVLFEIIDINRRTIATFISINGVRLHYH